LPSLLDKLRDIPLAFVDVETTGASCLFAHRVIEIGIVRVEGGQRVAEYQQLVDPGRKIGAGVVALTGITQEMVSGQPTFSEIHERVVELMRGAVVVGHNVRFDLSFLAGEFRRCRAPLQECLGAAHVLDTVRIARRRFGRGGNGLQRLAPRLGVTPTTAHRALADAVTTSLVFEKLLEPVGGWDMCLCDALAAQGGSMGLMPASPRESLLPLELQEALESRTSVLMEYVDDYENRTERLISPQQVRRRNGELLLAAHCHLRNDRRSFKLDRIVRLTKVENGIATDGAQMHTDREEGNSALSSSVSICAPSVANHSPQPQLFPPTCIDVNTGVS
jgi:DNA polymerase III epsilon subunit family exonuclease